MKISGASSGLACVVLLCPNQQWGLGDSSSFPDPMLRMTHERARGQNRKIQNNSFRILPLQYIVPVNFSLTCYSYAFISSTWSHNKLDFLECIVVKTIFTNFLNPAIHFACLGSVCYCYCLYLSLLRCYQQGSSLFGDFHKQVLDRFHPNSSAPHLPRLESNQAFFCSPLGSNIQPYLSLFVPNFISL